MSVDAGINDVTEIDDKTLFLVSVFPPNIHEGKQKSFLSILPLFFVISTKQILNVKIGIIYFI